MLRVQTPGDPSRGYGLGLSLEIDAAGRTIASHGGSVAGYTAHIAFDPDACIGVAILRNYQRGATDLRSAAHEVLLAVRDSRRP
jgi:CubicO group peptidase (beta-lactamase class C family)